MSTPDKRAAAMSASANESAFRRVFVVLDVTSDHSPAMESAASLAAGFDAELVALFVEHGQLEQLENHPLVRTLDLPTGMGRTIELGTMRRSWRAMAHRMRRQLAMVSRRYRVQSHFETIQGDVVEQIQQQAGSTDVFVVNSSGRALTRRVRVKSRSHTMGCNMAAPVVFVGQRPRQLRSVATVYDGSPLAKKGLQTALQLTTRPPAMLTVLLVADSGEQAQNMQQEISEMLRERRARVHPHARRITCCDTSEIVHVTRHVHASFLIIPGNADYPGGDDINELTRQLDCPLLVLREGRQQEPAQDNDDEK